MQIPTGNQNNRHRKVILKIKFSINILFFYSDSHCGAWSVQHVREDVYIGQITDMRRRATEQGRLWRRLGRARYEGNVANKYLLQTNRW